MSATDDKSISAEEPEPKTISQCQLILKSDGSIWVEAGGAGTGFGAMLNGQQLLHRARLGIGDVLKLGEESHAFLCIEDYEDNNMSIGGTDDEDNMEEEAVTIASVATVLNGAPALLSRILSFLSFEDLKSARLVAKRWYSLSKKYVHAQSIVSLQPSENLLDWEKDLREYTANFENFGHENFKICYTGHPTDGYVEEEILVFVRKHGRHFRKLDLTIMPGRNDFAYLRDVLESGLESLEEFSLTLVSNESDYATKYFPTGIVLNGVKSLFVNFGFDDESPQHLLKFGPVFIQSFPNIQKFKLTADDSSECLLEMMFLSTLSDGIREGVAFGDLQEIRLQWATPEIVDLIIDFPHTLSVIELHVDRNSVDTARLQSLIDRHAQVVQEFCIAVHGDYDDMDVGEPQIEMPFCPKLKRLSFTFYLADDASADLKPHFDVTDVDLLNFRGIFLSGEKCFQEKFPSLSSLHIVVTPPNQALFDEIFPLEDASGAALAFPQISEFKTVYPLVIDGADSNGCLITLVPGAVKIAKIFPNLKHNELSTVGMQGQFF